MRKYFDEITRIAGNVVTVKATDVGYDELAVITSERGSSLAQVIHLKGGEVSLQVFAGRKFCWAGFSTDRVVRLTGVVRSSRIKSISVRRR